MRIKKILQQVSYSIVNIHISSYFLLLHLFKTSSACPMQMASIVPGVLFIHPPDALVVCRYYTYVFQKKSKWKSNVKLALLRSCDTLIFLRLSNVCLQGFCNFHHSAAQKFFHDAYKAFPSCQFFFHLTFLENCNH